MTLQQNHKGKPLQLKIRASTNDFVVGLVCC